MEIYLVRLIAAMLTGIFIGFVNKYQSQGENTTPVRVFAMICIGAALVTIISTVFFKEFSSPWNSDPGRLSAQIVSALGFLGTGIIWMSEEERKLKGVYVAASLWLTAIIGMLIGVGLNSAAALGTFIILIIYWLYNFIDCKIKLKNKLKK